VLSVVGNPLLTECGAQDTVGRLKVVLETTDDSLTVDDLNVTNTLHSEFVNKPRCVNAFADLQYKLNGTWQDVLPHNDFVTNWSRRWHGEDIEIRAKPGAVIRGKTETRPAHNPMVILRFRPETPSTHYGAGTA